MGQFHRSMLCTVTADAPDASAVGMWEGAKFYRQPSKRSAISIAGALRGVPVERVAEEWVGCFSPARSGDRGKPPCDLMLFE